MKHLSIISLFLFFTVSLHALPLSAAGLCSQVFSDAAEKNERQKTEVKDLKTFGQAMTEGMLLRSEQSDLFGVYRKIFFGDANTSVNNETLKSVTDILKKHPELQKPHFREYEISTVEKIYETPESLAKYLRSQIQTAGEVRNNLLQIEANLGFWKKILDYHDVEMPDAVKQMQSKLGKDSLAADKEAYRTAKSTFESTVKKRFETYLNRMISKANRELLADLKSDKEDYQKKAKALFTTLKYIQEWMEKKARNTTVIRQAMVDLVHTVGFGNQATQALLKSKNGLERIEGLKKVLDERDAVAMELGYSGHFQQLQEILKIEFPTGLSKNENPSANIQKLEQDVLKANFSLKPTDTVRVRSLSIQEAPFRSCLGGSDCSTRTYFSKALDPNYNYFTITDSQHHSSGHVTVVLGEAQNPKTRQMEKVAFIDKLQNVPNNKIPAFFQAVSLSLAEHGYKLGVPEDVGDHNGLSNMDTIRHYVAQEIAPKLTERLKGFTPHPHQYQFPSGYSRAYARLAVKVYEPIGLDVHTDIRPGRSYQNFLAPSDLDKNKLIQDLLSLKNSPDANDVRRYISSGQIVTSLEKLGLFSVKEFQDDLRRIIERTDLPFTTRKQAAIEALLLNNEGDHSNSFQAEFNVFSETERVQMSAEIRQWVKSVDKRKREFAEGLINKWSSALQNGDIKTLKAFVALGLYDVNSRNESGFSLLVEAAYAGQKAVVEWLIENPKLDLAAKDEFGFTDVEQLRLVGKPEIADLIEARRPESKSRRFEVKERNADGTPIFDFVKIQPGKFIMGDRDGKFAVTLTKPFEMMSTLTTQKMWKEVWYAARRELRDEIEAPSDPSYNKGEQNPVEQVEYDDVVTWIKALNKLSKLDDFNTQETLKSVFPGHKKGDVYRLPSEAEYEFVARMRGLANGDYSHGNTEKNLGDYAWYDKNSGGTTHPVGLKKPIIINGKPIYDIHGNVWTWTGDWYNGILSGGTDPVGPASGSNRVIRGGSWNHRTLYLLSGFRGDSNPGCNENFVGFRLVRTAK